MLMLLFYFMESRTAKVTKNERLWIKMNTTKTKVLRINQDNILSFKINNT